ncbi:2-oxo acid dehydrogenase subunit E2, partial [Staphylococcus simulans]
VAPKAPTPTPASTATQSDNSQSVGASDTVIPVNGVRRQIANKMVQSVHEIPHAWMAIEVDATELTKTRAHYKNQFKAQEGYN